MTYLDDADHDWSIDPAAVRGRDLGEELAEFVDEVRETGGLDGDAFDLIVRGYLGLRARHPEATAGECFGTSLVWYFG